MRPVSASSQFQALLDSAVTEVKGGNAIIAFCLTICRFSSMVRTDLPRIKSPMYNCVRRYTELARQPDSHRTFPGSVAEPELLTPVDSL